MTTTEPTPYWVKSARDRAELDELQHRLRSARIWATVLSNDPDPMAAALGRQFLDYLEPTQAEPVGVIATEYRVMYRPIGARSKDWSVWANTEHRADVAESAHAVAMSEGFTARVESRITIATAWTPVHTDDTDTES
jgi:hypothetical protein